MMNIKVVSKKLVKPCIPTPPHLKTYNFSFLDEFLPLTEVGTLLFYESRRDMKIDLEESLAKVLVQFYPLAGRLVLQDQIVHCNDKGAEFIEAEAPDVDLASLILERDLENLYGFLPRINHQVDVSSYPLLSIQVTRLKAGCVAIGISVSHKIFDGASMATFVAAWSNATNPERGENMAIINPRFDTAELFPGNKSNYFSIPTTYGETKKIIVKRFSFDEEAIADLRLGLKSVQGNPKRVSRVSLVCAFIAKVQMGMDRVKHGRFRDCLISMPVNMRERTIPPLPKQTCGNLLLLSICTWIAAPRPLCGPEVAELVDMISEATSGSISDCKEILSFDGEGRNERVMKPMMDAVAAAGARGVANGISFSDYSKFGFYEADFGWGKPVWASIAPQPGAKMTVLMERKEGNGIEAWVHLEEDDMALFEQDDEIRMFATLDYMEFVDFFIYSMNCCLMHTHFKFNLFEFIK